MTALYKTCAKCGLNKHYSRYSKRPRSEDLQPYCKKCRAQEQGRKTWDTVCVKCKRFVKIYLDNHCRLCTPILKCKKCGVAKLRSEFNGLTCCNDCAILKARRTEAKYKEKIEEKLKNLRYRILQFNR